MNAPSLDKTESLLLLGVAGLILYGAWRASKTVGDVANASSRAWNNAAQTVQDYARAVPDAAWMMSPMGQSPSATASQIASWWNNWGADYASQIGDMETASQDDPTRMNPYDFYDLSATMAKPSYGELSQPASDYPQ